MTTKSLKGFTVKQEMKDGKLKVTFEAIPFYCRSASGKIAGRKSKRVSVKHPGFAALFERKG